MKPYAETEGVAGMAMVNGELYVSAVWPGVLKVIGPEHGDRISQVIPVGHQ